MTPWIAACQAPLSLEFSRQEYWGGLPCPFPGDLPNPRVKLGSPALQADSLPFVPPDKSHGGAGGSVIIVSGHLVPIPVEMDLQFFQRVAHIPFHSAHSS